MFTRRHEQELAEIKALAQELDRGITEVLEHVKGMQGTSRQAPMDHEIRHEIEALGVRHGLAGKAIDTLRELVRLVDWSQPNFLPRPDSGRPEGELGLRTPSTRVAVNLLSESLAGLELEPLRAATRLGDVGSGAGFPGLVLAIALPRAHVTLMERIPERCAFLRRAAAELGLENVDVVETQLEPGSGAVGPFDVVTSRKVGRLNTMVEVAAPLLAPGGAVALWPGTTDFAEDEREAAADAAGAAGLRLARVLPIRSENRKGRRVVKHLYMYEKTETSPRPRPARRPDSLVAFVHIPKTAGGTVTAMLAGVYGVSAIGKSGNYLSDAARTQTKVTKRSRGSWESWHREGGKLVVGHTPYAVLREALPRNTRYMTFLREPVDRVLSHYDRHIRRRNPRRAGTPKDLASVKPRAESLEEALVEMRLPALSNLATRFLSMDPSPELGVAALDAAKANLRDFAFVGIQERFEESIVLLERTLGLELAPEREDRHVSMDRPTVADLPADQRALIEEYNQLDRALYEFAVELFDAAVSGSGEGFAADVDRLRALRAGLREPASAASR